MSNVTEIKSVPQSRSRVIIRLVCNFKTRGERRVVREEDQVEQCEGNERREWL